MLGGGVCGCDHGAGLQIGAPQCGQCPTIWNDGCMRHLPDEPAVETDDGRVIG